MNEIEKLRQELAEEKLKVEIKTEEVKAMRDELRLATEAMSLLSQEMKQSEIALKKKMRDLETFRKIAVGRELTMVELKKRVKELEAKLGER
ncbi:MAG: hypothetical protein KKD11_02210 [Candidatus Omnitrophica bacterium]|nr:hypothetical protein [Candidatus Omnitrophota bacterium]